MIPTFVIVLGGEVPENHRNTPSLLIRLPGESGRTDGERVIAPKSLDECLLFLRRRFCHHTDIATLASTEIIAGHFLNCGQAAKLRPEWADAIENKLSELLDDLGNCSLDTLKGAVHFLRNLPVMEYASTSQELQGIHAGEAVVCVGSGPSASEQMETLARIRNGVRIFCADSILSGLLAKGITPDYVCALEREESIGKLLEGYENCGATLICSPFLCPEIAKKWGKNVCFWWSDDHICEWANPEIEQFTTGRSAGSLALAASLLSGARVCYLIGHDLAYKNGQSHASDAHSLASEVAKKADADAHAVNPLRQRVKTEANHSGEAETNGLWLRVRGDLEGIIANHPDQIVVNACGWNAARISGAVCDVLPECPAALPSRPRLMQSFPSLPHDAAANIAKSAQAAQVRLMDIIVDQDLWDTPSKAADAIQVSRIVPGPHAKFFHYLTRAIYSNMLLRIHYNVSRGIRDDESHRAVLRLAIKSLCALFDRLRRELA